MFVFSLHYWRKTTPDRSEHFTESVLATSMQDALTYWQMEFADTSIELEHIIRGEPIIAISPFNRALSTQQAISPEAQPDNNKSN